MMGTDVEGSEEMVRITHAKGFCEFGFTGM
jgi:hypothetical protein